MISQILPRIVRATTVVRYSESGSWSELGLDGIAASSREPLSGLYPEAFEATLESAITMEELLQGIGFACLRHKAILEVRARSSKPMPSAVLSIVSRSGSHTALAVIRGKKALFILPAPSR